MKLFVDTSAWLALNDHKDQYHQAAMILAARIREEKISLVTTDYIFDESLTLIRTRGYHQSAVRLGETLLKSRLAQLVVVDSDVRLAAFEMFKKYADKDLSFTDCTSFALMKRLKLKVAFTFDSHFQQVGFEEW